MATTFGKHSGAASKSDAVIKIPADLFSQLEALPNRTNGKIVFTPVQDEIILRYGGTKTFKAIGNIIGLGESVTVRRYNHLMECISAGKEVK